LPHAFRVLSREWLPVPISRNSPSKFLLALSVSYPSWVDFYKVRDRDNSWETILVWASLTVFKLDSLGDTDLPSSISQNQFKVRNMDTLNCTFCSSLIIAGPLFHSSPLFKRDYRLVFLESGNKLW
jgi:hypothetical protein